MEESELQAELNSVLSEHTKEATEKLNIVLNNIPEKAISINLEIFTSQDREGFFSVGVNLDGPDLYVLNKAIREYVDIFDPKYTENGIEPYIPTVDPFEIEYEANDTVVDCVANWLREIWDNVNKENITIPVYIVGHDEYGTTTPIQLQ